MKKRELKARIAQLEAENAALRERLELANRLLDLWYPYPRQHPAYNSNQLVDGDKVNHLRWPGYAGGGTDDESIRWSSHVQGLTY